MPDNVTLLSSDALSISRPAFQVVHEDDDFWVIDKAAGIDCMSSDGAPGLFHYAAEQLGPVFPVHRLDKITSGLLLLAKTSAAAAALSQLFTQHQIEKYYLAVSASKPRKKQGWVKGGMQRSRRGQWRLSRDEKLFAKTQFVSVAHPLGRLFVLKPYTGRTHQLRVALKSLGSPILGDQLYGGAEAERGFLHAQALCFHWQGHQLRYTSQLHHQKAFFPDGVLDASFLDAPWAHFLG